LVLFKKVDTHAVVYGTPGLLNRFFSVEKNAQAPVDACINRCCPVYLSQNPCLAAAKQPQIIDFAKKPYEKLNKNQEYLFK